MCKLLTSTFYHLEIFYTCYLKLITRRWPGTQEFPCCLLYLVVEQMRMHPPVSSFRSWKNFWLKMKATPLISSTLASAVVFLFIKLAVMAIASFPRNSFLLKPGEQRQELKPLQTSDWTFREGQLKAAQYLSYTSSSMPSVDSTMPPKFPLM